MRKYAKYIIMGVMVFITYITLSTIIVDRHPKTVQHRYDD